MTTNNKKIILKSALFWFVSSVIVILLASLFLNALYSIDSTTFIIIVCVTFLFSSLLYAFNAFNKIETPSNESKKLITALIFGPVIIIECITIAVGIWSYDIVLETEANERTEAQEEAQQIEEVLAAYGLEDTGYTMRQTAPGFLKKMVCDSNGNYLEVYLLEDDDGEYIVYTCSDGVYSPLEGTE